MNGYEALGNAIILRAVEDYEDAIGVLCTQYDWSDRKRMIENTINKDRRMKFDCEKFFNSEFYKILTTIPSELIMKNIIEGVEAAEKTHYDDEKKGFVCTCGNKLNIRRSAIKAQTMMPVIKCIYCKRYWRVFGERA